MLTFLAKERKRILEFILNNPGKKIKIRELARTLKLSPAYVSRTIKVLHKEGIIKENRVNLNNPLIRAMKILINTERLIKANIISKVKALSPIGVGIYGSWANGTNCEDSDLDIWVRVKKHPGEVKIASLTSEIRGSVGTNVQVLVLTPEKVRRLKIEDPIFYYSLVFGSIVIYGEGLE
jgi:DNA-binding Lrp family transcriptional regulator